MTDALVRINDELSIPLAELGFRASRSGGPGGQHVNTSSTRVELMWNVEGSPSLTEEQRARLLEKLGNRISGEGLLLLAASGSRSQHRNREEVTERFAEILAAALHVPKKRRKTRPGRAAREARLESKKRRARTKKMRRPVRPD
jgi:ribosome-associated protein